MKYEKQMESNIRVQPFTGNNVKRYIPEVAKLRIEVFREFPYLYDGNMEYEEKYLHTYTKSPESVIVIAFDHEDIIGASTAVPLIYETDEVKKPFIANNIDPATVFYLGESVLLKSYRGHGIGVRFFQEREAHARQIGDFNWCAFCAVDRPNDHPRKPSSYVPLNEFWKKRGYSRHPELQTTFTWRDLDEASESPKPMVFWLKAFKSLEK